MSGIASFFTGCGSIDLGFQLSDFDVQWSLKDDPKSIQTYRANFPATRICTQQFLQLQHGVLPQKISGFVVGASYFDFNEFKKSGLSANFEKLLSLADMIQPNFIFLDNAPRLTHSKNAAALDYLLNGLEKAGYQHHLHTVNATTYATPNQRRHSVIIAFRQDLHIKYWLPKKKATLTLRQTLDGLSTAQARPSRKAAPVPTNQDYPHTLLSGKETACHWNKAPSLTRPQISHIPLHPDAFNQEATPVNRKLSVRECARIQTFPDDFIFQYRDLQDGYEQVIDYMPVNLAKYLSLSIKRTIESLYWY